MDSIELPTTTAVILVSASAWEWYLWQHEIIMQDGKQHPKSKHVLLNGSHYIFHDHPDSIINYIKELVSDVR